MGRRFLSPLLVIVAIAGCNTATPSTSATASPTTAASSSAKVSAVPSSTAPSSVAPTSPPPSGGPTGDTPPRLTVEPFVSGLQDPLDIAWRPNDPASLFIVE